MGVHVQTRYQRVYTAAFTDVATTCLVDVAPAFNEGYATVRRTFPDQEDIKWRNVSGLQLQNLLRGLSPTALVDTEVIGLRRVHNLNIPLPTNTIEGTTLHYIANNKPNKDDAETITGFYTFTAGLSAPFITGLISLRDTANNFAISIDTTAGAVNWLRVTPSSTGNAIIVRPDGTDVNVNFEIQGRGTGVAIVPDGSVTKTTAAPTTDAMIANKKYVDDSVGALSILTPAAFQAGAQIYGATAGGTTAYTLSLTPALLVYTTGMRVYVRWNATNTGATTLDINGLGAKSVVKYGTQALVAGDARINDIDVLAYDGTNFQIVGNASPFAFLTTKGDLVVATAANTPTRYGVGADGTVPTADSGAGTGYSNQLPYLPKVGADTWNVTANGQTKVITHSLGRVPKLIEVICYFTGTSFVCSHGFYTPGDGNIGMTISMDNTGTQGVSGSNTTNIIVVGQPTTTVGEAWTATITATSTTTFTMTSANYANTRNVVFIYKVLA